MAESPLPPDARTRTLGVVFFDLERFGAWAGRESDERVAAFLQAFYVQAADRLRPAGARIVKFIGDAGLAVFPPERADETVAALRRLAEEVEKLGRECGFDTRLSAGVHVGPVVEGSFGPPDLARYDVLGWTVNRAAVLPRGGMMLSPEAWEHLSPAARTGFERDAEKGTFRAAE